MNQANKFVNVSYLQQVINVLNLNTNIFQAFMMSCLRKNQNAQKCCDLFALSLTIKKLSHQIGVQFFNFIFVALLLWETYFRSRAPVNVPFSFNKSLQQSMLCHNLAIVQLVIVYSVYYTSSCLTNNFMQEKQVGPISTSDWTQTRLRRRLNVWMGTHW